ncbi:hypothetical protein MVES1_000096 [Malassezia vespertilionis]|uniref:uncharacterized protein n=1 Tax=Malassezia vespertilionis TaxID=2020962 RepID=UPI0024B18D80|nr:uncharacterized protein MVES1_000096 [Malassezia vespertilionis]WFD04772.1 hypothetical protein MVES1_000096 [Malassezia vespertilionis]
MSPKKTSVIVEALMQVDGIEQSSKPSVVQEEHVDTLRVKPKPIRGPAGQKQHFWDAQHPEKHIPAAKNSAELAALQQYAGQLASKLQEMTEEYGQEHKLVVEMRAKLVHLRGTMKGIRKAEMQREREAALAMCPVKAMEQVVQGLVDSEHIWLGLPRWHKKGNNKYLAP